MNGQDLKNSILQLAMQGKLVEQRPEEGTGEELYQQIQEEKQKLISEGKLKKEKPLPEINKEEIPYEIPKSWKWLRLGDYAQKVTDYVASGSFKSLRNNVKSLKTEDYALMVKTADFSNSFSTNLTFTDKHGYEFLSNSNLFGGELILSNIGSIGKVFIVPKLNRKMTLAPNSVMVKLIQDDLIKYLYYLILSDFGYKSLMSITSGTAMKKFNKTMLKTILVPIPPLLEQQRIVEKLEQMFPIVEEYGKLEREREDLDVELPEKLKKSILQYAMQGKLVPQIPSEGTAEELYAQIQEEKQKLIAEGKLKKEKLLPPITEDEIPFQIPPTWKWVRAGEIGSWASGSTPSRNNPAHYGGNVPWLKTGDLNDSFINEVSEYITELALNNTSVRLNPIGSVLMAMYGATIGKLGILNIATTTNQACCACIPYNGINNKYLFYYLMAMRSYFIKQGEGGAQPNISKEKILNSVFPLPPLNEQKRIVIKIDQSIKELA